MARSLLRLVPWLGIVAFAGTAGYYAAVQAPAFEQAQALAAAGTTGVAEENWYAVLYQDKRLGYTHSSRTPLAAGGTEMLDEMRLKMNLMGQSRDVATVTQMQLDGGGVMASFDFKMTSAGVDIRVTGRQLPGKVSLVMYSAGDTQTVDFPVEQPIVMAANLPLDLAKAGLRPGAKYTRSFFDPSVMKPSVMQIAVEAREPLKVGARTIDLFRVKQTYSGLETTSWIDPAGVVYKEVSPTGFSSYRTTKEDALRPSADAAIDLIEATSVPAAGAPADPRKTMKLTVELSGVELAGFDLDGDGQELSGKTLVVDRIGKHTASIDPAAYLKGEPLMQVDNPDLKAAAGEATGGVKEPEAASRRVLKWVYGNLSKTSTVSLPSALEVLRSRQGDCNEHAILYTAMNRAAGVPTRIASGLVALGDRFYYHAWAEVYLDGRWLAVDPVFGQYPADATHLRFVVGGLDRQAELMRVIGRLKIKVVAADPG